MKIHVYEKCEMNGSLGWLPWGDKAFPIHGPVNWGDAGGQRFILKVVLPELTWVDDITSVFHSTNTLLGKCVNHCKAGYCIFYTINKPE